MPETIRFTGLELRFLHSKDDTEGSVDLFEMTVQPNARMLHGNASRRAFDLLTIDGRDLRQLPLWARGKLLAALLEGSPEDALLFSGQVEGAEGGAVFWHTCEMNLSGIGGSQAPTGGAGSSAGGTSSVQATSGRDDSPRAKPQPLG